MKRLIVTATLIVIAIASIVAAQGTNQATLRLASGDRPLTLLRQNGLLFFSADEVMAALGGSVTADANGFKVSLNNSVAAFGPDSRYGVVKDDLIEMPVPPITADNKAYVPWQFFQGFLKTSSDMDVAWDATSRVLAIRPAQHNVINVQLAVTNVQGISKIVATLSGPADYTIVKEQQAYTIRFRTAIHAPFTDQAFDDPYVNKATFQGNDLRLQLTASDIVGDAYKLENPVRLVLDLHKGSASATSVAPPPTNAKPVDTPGIHTIVIDPGHGGKDVGAIGPGGLMEKDATLLVAHRLADEIGRKMNVRVILTRSDDTLISLDQRTAIANQYKADLFLSVHMNAAVVKGAHGSETYFLSADASDELARKAAETENASAKAASPGAASSSDLKMILWDLAQQEYLSESSRLAQAVQDEMNRATGVQSRGVKQAPFKVLVGATMPAALVEVAFITNPEEEAKLRKDEFITTVVGSLTAAVQRYKTDYETRIGIIQPAPVSTTPAAATTTGHTPTTTATTTSDAKRMPAVKPQPAAAPRTASPNPVVPKKPGTR
jgi:N-acetylmuramoyl-L-alanine amidase